MLAPDPHYDSVDLLLPMRGEAGTSLFFDYALKRAITISGSAVSISGTDAKYYGQCGLFENLSYLNTGPANLTQDDDFTVEAWIRPESFANPSGVFFFGSSGSNLRRIQSDILTTGFIGFYAYGVSEAWSLRASQPLTLNQWTHVAFVRNATAVGLFLDGQLSASKTISGSVTPFSDLHVGVARTANTGRYFYGRIQDFRFTKAARYVGDFTPPRQMTELVAGGCIAVDANTTLQTLSGAARKVDLSPAERILIHDATTGALIASAVPDPDGSWSAQVVPGQYDLTYLADGCAPVCHGPYAVIAP